MTLNAAVQAAIVEIQNQFPDAVVTASGTGDGGAWVHLEPVPLSDTYREPSTWVVFQIPFSYPDADVYPHFVRPDLSRRDGQPLGESFSVGSYGPDETPAVQVSRRTPDLLRNNATVKLLKVIEWVQTR